MRLRISRRLITVSPIFFSKINILLKVFILLSRIVFIVLFKVQSIEFLTNPVKVKLTGPYKSLPYLIGKTL